MPLDPADRELAETLAALRGEVAALSDRLASVEAALAVGASSAVTAAAPARQQSADVPEETLAIISAVLAAYLGVKPHIRQITLAGGASWANQGRVTIQASHALAIQRD